MILDLFKPIVEIPMGATLPEEQPVLLQCITSSSSPVTYKWMKGGKVMEGTESSTLFINSLSRTDSGSYTCVVNNGKENKSSDMVEIFVECKFVSRKFSKVIFENLLLKSFYLLSELFHNFF